MRDGVVESFEAQFITGSGSAQAKIGDLWCAGEPERGHAPPRQVAPFREVIQARLICLQS
jgi:hypothetical protein